MIDKEKTPRLGMVQRIRAGRWEYRDGQGRLLKAGTLAEVKERVKPHWMWKVTPRTYEVHEQWRTK